ncbi:MAG: hypothetical protein H0W12_02245 [Chitinophagaceae bacterium]|nr:hypothetical protein [Chitinophagaceae bacterium]
MKTLLTLLLLPIQLLAQDITGIWAGFITTTDKQLPYEIVISDNNGKLNGYSHTTFTVKGVEFVAVKSLKVKNDNGTILIEDDDQVFNNFTSAPPKKIKQYNVLSLKKEDSILILSGGFNTNTIKHLGSAIGTIRLQKQDTSAITKIIPQLKELSLLGNLSFLQPKEKEIIAIAPPPVEKPVLLPSKEKEKEIISPASKEEKPPPVIQSKPTLTTKIIPPPEKKSNQVTKTKTDIVVKPPVVPPASKPKEKPLVVSNKQPVDPDLKTVAVIQSVKPNKELFTAPVASTPDLSKRTIETIQGVFIKTDSITLSLYDNGEVDGDTVSIILNGKVIISKQGLSTIAFTKTIYMTPDLGDSMQLIMYAENLGSIPPNTGLLILQDGDARYEIRFTGDLQKNAAIILRRKH